MGVAGFRTPDLLPDFSDFFDVAEVESLM